GDIVIAAITSCTNTSNPSVMLGAGLLAKKAVERGLKVKPWVKTSLAPGSQVVSDYYAAAGLQEYLDKVGFNLVGYGCTTCIGNSGPLPEPVADAIDEGDLAVCAVLSGNGNVSEGPPEWRQVTGAGGLTYDFEDRSTYLALPPYFENMPKEPGAVSDVIGARELAIFGDSITTDHISPAGSIKTESPAGEY